jgi:UDP-3-O-[3-hydroxymyristoyl] glucosamine N-acyltransferase
VIERTASTNGPRPEFTLADLAVRFGLKVVGEPSLRVSHVASLESAGPGALSFLANSKFRKHLNATRATAVVVAPKDVDLVPVAALVHPNPYASYARIASVLHPPAVQPPGAHLSAIVAASARIDPSASIGALSVIEDEVELGPGTQIGPGCIIQRGARIGAHTQLVARVTVCPRVVIGVRCVLHPGSVIGADGFGFAPDRPGWVKVPQIGSVRIGDDVDIGCNTTIDRGTIEDTEIGNGVKLDNQIQIGHNVKIGEHTIMAACSGISGSTTVGKRCVFGGMIGFAGHITIVDDVMITGFSMVSASLTEPGTYSSGIPAEPSRRWRRIVARIRQLDPPRKDNSTNARSEDD